MVACFGELLLRFSPAANGAWIEQCSMPVYIGGAEFNVATALANWDVAVKYITALPPNQLTAAIINLMQHKNIRTNGIQQQGDRIGLYYLPAHADLKNPGVIYDRAGSSFSMLKTGALHWPGLLQSCSWFHFSAITPALNSDMPALCTEALQAAKQQGITVSVDLNHRPKLWQYGQQPSTVMPGLMQYCDVVMGNVWSAQQLLGIRHDIADGDTSFNTLTAAADKCIQQIQLNWPQVKTIALTFRMADTYFAVLHQHQQTITSAIIPIKNIINQAGSGDCFMAGLIYGIRKQWPVLQTVNFAVTAATGKLYEPGDYTLQTLAQIFTRLP
jgi:2-dehydro-3-deoxygluconokinase